MMGIRQALVAWVAMVILVTGDCRSVLAQATLAVVEEVPFDGLRERCEQLMKSLEAAQAPLPVEVEKELKALLREGAKEPGVAAEKIQKLLDARCLCGITINPESRVKTARGALAAELVRDKPTVVLIKVHNDAGVTAPLKISGPQVREAKDDKGWLAVTVLESKLSGSKLEYAVVRLTGQESGKREATLRFDVGQGTQDLGFRAEVPILFSVK